MARFVVKGIDSTLGTSLCEAAGVDPNMVRRLVLDLRVGDMGMLYLETYPDDAVLDVSLSGPDIKIELDEGETA